MAEPMNIEDARLTEEEITILSDAYEVIYGTVKAIADNQFEKIGRVAIPLLEKGAREEIIKEIRQAIAIEYKKATEESNQMPFPAKNLNDEHKILWQGHANAYSETLSYLDILVRRLSP